VEREEPRTAGPRRWGSLGRKGAGRLTAAEFDARDSVGATGRDDRPAPPRDEARWVRVDDVRDAADRAVGRGRSPRPEGRAAASAAPKQRRGRAPREASKGTGGADAKAELLAALGAARGARANERLRDAAHAFERERFEEARSLLRPIATAAPQAASVRELLGLTYYRLGRWKDAVAELEAFRQLTGSAEQHPVLADSYRAQGRHREVEDLWEELREASPAADLVTEGRIVMAGSMADRGRLADAVALLERSHRAVRRVDVHHLRQAYALADLYERGGDAARARELFRWVADHEPDFADAAERAAALG
jgi:tetratricopeptide (TPR) repeat protein